MLSLDDFWLRHRHVGRDLRRSIFLSITVITGMGGQISLCQATFAAVGGFTTAQLVNEFDLPVLLTVLAGAVLAAIVGALLAIPALRLGGIYLALATLAFALMFDSILVPLDWVGGGPFPLDVPRPEFIEDDHAFFLFSVAVLAVVGVLVILVRARHDREVPRRAARQRDRGELDRHQRDARHASSRSRSPRASPVSAAGCSRCSTRRRTTRPTTRRSSGLVWIVLVVTIGARTVEGAIVAGLALALFPELLKELGIPLGVQFILFGLGALTYAKHPEGILEAQKRMAIEAIQRLIDRRKGKSPEPTPEPRRPRRRPPAASESVAP